MTTNRDHHSQLAPAWRLLHQRTVLVLTLLFGLAAAVLLWHKFRMSRTLVQSTALQNAALYSEAIAAFRTLYTSEVVEVVRKQGITVTHDYRQHAGAIPLPVTLSMQLGKQIGSYQSGAETRLYSPYPFPWRKEDGGLRDEFAQQAWGHLTRNPDQRFYQFEHLNGRAVLRYATADTMRRSCVECHNTHPDSPKIDWKEGEVRGVLEVVLPMTDVEEATTAGVRESIVLIAAIMIVGVSGLAVVIGRLRQTTEDLQHRMREAKQHESQIQATNELLVEARDAALAASRAKSQFLTNMSHELRTPLNAIIGYSELLQEDADEQGQGQLLDDLARIHKSAMGLLGIIDDVLEIANIETGYTRLTTETFDLAPLLDDVVNAIEPAIKEKGLRFDYEVSEKVGQIVNDRLKLRLCLLHLLSNACKFTEEGAVRFHVCREPAGDGDWIRFTVRDTGIGMSSQHVAGLFEAFMQADSSSTRKYGGTGLGLAITHNLCRLMGGVIKVESEPGRGTTITFRIPVDVDAAAVDVRGAHSAGGNSSALA